MSIYNNLERMLSNSDNKRIYVHDYAVALKLSGFTMTEAIDNIAPACWACNYKKRLFGKQ